MQDNLPRTWAEFRTELDARQRNQMALMLDNKASYDRFYDMVNRSGDEAACDFLPAEAKAVAAIENSAAALAEFRQRGFAVLAFDLCNQVKKIASERNPAITNPACMLRHDLNALDSYRVENCDGINGRMWEALTQRAMSVSPTRNTGLADLVVKAWAKHVEIDYQTVANYVWTATLLINGHLASDPSFVKSEYSFLRDVTGSDLDDYAEWPEAKPDNIAAIREQLFPTPKM